MTNEEILRECAKYFTARDSVKLQGMTEADAIIAIRAILLKLAEIGMSEEMRAAGAEHFEEVNGIIAIAAIRAGTCGLTEGDPLPKAFTASLRALAGEKHNG